MKRTKLNKTSKQPLPRLKRKLEALQRKACEKLYPKNCYTCHQENLNGVDCQMGHVPWPKSILGGWRYDIRFVRWQCYNCNINRGGMGAEALSRMQFESPRELAQMEIDRKISFKVDRIFVEFKIAEYEKLCL